jgi:hypothetical protein
MPYDRNNQDPANAMPVWMAPAPSGSSIITPQALLRQNIEASQTDVVIGSPGTIGDWLSGIVLTPLTASPGAVSIRNGILGTYRIVFAGGVGSVTDLSPRVIPYPSFCTIAGGWFVTTGANMRVSVFGNWIG